MPVDDRGGRVHVVLVGDAVPAATSARRCSLGGVVPAAGWLVIGGARHGVRGVAIALVALASD